MKNLYITVCAAALLAACSESGETSGNGTDATSLTSGIRVESIDTSVRPQDDFYQYVNGIYLNTAEIPSDRATYSVFTELAERNEGYLRAIIDGLIQSEHEAGTDAQKVSDLYNSFVDMERINALGAKPVEADLARIQAVSSKADLVDIFAYFATQGGTASTPVAFFVNQDARDATRYSGQLTQSGLGLPDREYYLKTDEKSLEILASYRAFIAKLFTLTGADNADDRADRVVALETALAEHQWLRTENRDRNKTYNKVTLEELAALTPDFDWARYFTVLGTAAQETLIVRQPSYLEGFNTVFAATDLDDWKDYLSYQLISGYAPHLSEEFVDANFDFFGKTMRGTPEKQPRWKRAIARVNGDVGHALGKLYTARHFKPEAKARMKELVENLRTAFADRLDNLEWMSAETRVQAKDKLGKFYPKIGYPDQWRDYSSLDIKPDDLIGNVRRARIYNFKRNVNRLGQPIDRLDWGANPQLVNAFYSSTLNQITFPAGILQAPFFDMEADDAVNYGAIGAVIGHEMGHGFDDQGSKSDGDGNLRNWWTDNDRAEFDKRGDALVAEYDAFEPLPGLHVNGRLTLGENIGDLGGLTIAYHAYKMSLNGQEAPVIDGFTGDQRFFLGWGQIWRRLSREKALRRQVVVDPHSPGQYRANGIVVNIPAFYDAFDVREGDGMYRAPEDRISIW